MDGKGPACRLMRRPATGTQNRASLQLRYDGLEAFFGDWCTNMDVGAIFVRTDVPLQEGCAVRLRILLPGALGTIETTAHVAWSISPQQSGGLAAGMGLHVDPPQGPVGPKIEKLARAWDARPGHTPVATPTVA